MVILCLFLACSKKNNLTFSAICKEMPEELQMCNISEGQTRERALYDLVGKVIRTWAGDKNEPHS